MLYNTIAAPSNGSVGQPKIQRIQIMAMRVCLQPLQHMTILNKYHTRGGQNLSYDLWLLTNKVTSHVHNSHNNSHNSPSGVKQNGSEIYIVGYMQLHHRCNIFGLKK